MADAWDKPQYNGNALVGAAIGVAVVQVVFVAARFYTRFMQRMKVAVDDYLILLALIASLAKSAIYIFLAKIGAVGYHIDYTNQLPGRLVILRKYMLALQILDYPLCVTAAKLALLIFFARIFTIRKFRIASYVVGSLVIAVGVAAFLETLLQCRHLASTWEDTIPGRTCVSQITAYRVLSPINAFTGVLILLMPIPEVWKLHVPRGQKLALTGVFLLGGLGAVASLLRMAIYFAKDGVAKNDPTWVLVELGILVVIESGVIIIASCLMSIWPLFTRILPRRVQASFSRMPRETQHQYWYLRDNPSNSRSDQQIERCKEVLTIRQDSWNSSLSSPCSLADLEDQRLSILADDTTEPRSNGVRACHIKSAVYN